MEPSEPTDPEQDPARARPFENYTPRICPKCGADFQSVQDRGQCPQCRYTFCASTGRPPEPPDWGQPVMFPYGLVLLLMVGGLVFLLWLVGVF